jgi:hypothetical protein
MSTVIEHVRHRVSEIRVEWFDNGDWFHYTSCGRPFLPADEKRNRRDIAHHEPATSRCRDCYP